VFNADLMSVLPVFPDGIAVVNSAGCKPWVTVPARCEQDFSYLRSEYHN